METKSSTLFGKQAGLIYNTVDLFGFGKSGQEPLPEASDGEIVIRYGGWSLRELCANPMILDRNLMSKKDGFHGYPWDSEKLPAGIYRLRIPVPHSNEKTATEQRCSFLSDEESAPVVLGVTALLAHNLQTDADLLKGVWVRCKEQTVDNNCAALRWLGGQLYVFGLYNECRSPLVWAVSSRKY